MANLDQSIRDAIHAYLKRCGMSGRRFGCDALGDPGFVSSLGKGRRLGLKTADCVLAFMGEPTLGPAFRREVEVFLAAGGAKPYVFGEAAAGDSSFVDRLRGGASLRLQTVDKVRAWMGAQADEACLRAMARAVAGVPLLAREVRRDRPAKPCNSERQGETNMRQDGNEYLSTRKAAAYLGLSPRTLDRLRSSGEGPAFHRFGKRILYRRSDLDAWAAERRVSSTSQYGGPRRSGVTTARGRATGRAKEAVRTTACAVMAWAGLLAFGFGVDPAMAASDTTFAGPLDTVTDIVAGTGGQLAAALAVGAALVGSVLRFNAMQLMGAVGVGIAAGAGVGIVTGLVGTAIV